MAISVSLAFKNALRFFKFAEKARREVRALGAEFAHAEAIRVGLSDESAIAVHDSESPKTEVAANKSRKSTARLFSRLFAKSRLSKPSGVEQHVITNALTVTDFDLLRVVGKGAFGKVMLVRKRAAPDEGRIFAMKVLKKSVIAAKGQTEHTRSERSILCEIRHPYIVRLRYAFQSEEKLYLVTDYYNGGSLFYHLRKSRGFQEPRARFYGAELVLALDHLHANGVIYRQVPVVSSVNLWHRAYCNLCEV